ncbi:MAG TPA: glycosyltransferase family A protein [Gammaproteobacteria bacterium]|nr:glycosyltransferase family A protein [Gammaproteobacteria bacterium]
MSDSISVVVPTFNRSGTLRRALQSIARQTRAPDQIIVVDDGSTDDTRQMVTSRFPQAIYLHQPNRGVSSARNLGINSASGEWIALLDSDDEWLPGKLSAQLELLGSLPDYRICHTEEIWIRSGRRVNQMKKHTKCGGDIFLRCLPLCVISPSSALIHRSLFDRIGLFDESLPACEDYDLWLRICASHPVAYVTTPQVVKYGGHQDQLSRRYWGMDRFRIAALEEIIQSGSLTGEALSAARAMVSRKARIVAGGAAKRGEWIEAARYREIADSYARTNSD